MINKTRDVIDLYSRTETWLCDEFKFTREDDRLNLLYKNRRLDKNLSLTDAGITDDAKVFVQIKDEEADMADAPEEIVPRAIECRQSAEVGHAKESELPKAPKFGYNVNPPMHELHRMSLKQL